jgi:hypothetical protein
VERDDCVSKRDRGRKRRREVREETHDTGPLLHHLERSTEDSAAEVGRRVEDGAGEAGSPRGEPRTGLRERGKKESQYGWGRRRERERTHRNVLSLNLSVGNDLGKLDLDVLGRRGLTTETDEGIASVVETAALDEVTGRVGEEEESSSKDHTPGESGRREERQEKGTGGKGEESDELDTDGNAVRARVGAVLGEVADDGGEHDTDGDGELVAGDEGTANLARANLGHVKNDDGGNESDTDTSDDTTDDDGGQGRGSEHLGDDTSEVDGTTCERRVG